MKKVVIDSRSCLIRAIDPKTGQTQGICDYCRMDGVLVVLDLQSLDGCRDMERKLLRAAKRLARQEGLAVAAASYLKIDPAAAAYIERARIPWHEMQGC
jgi:hypothetical protein